MINLHRGCFCKNKLLTRRVGSSARQGLSDPIALYALAEYTGNSRRSLRVLLNM